MRRFAPVALSLLLSAAAFAQQTPNLAKGFNAETTYDFTNLEAVNLFNGSITMSVPIGQAYTVGPTLSYRFSLVYTGNNWLPEDNTWYEILPGNPGVETSLSYYEPYGSIAIADGSHVGLGWHFSMGELVSKWLYIAPDGSHHEFHGSLTSPGTTSASSNANVSYSNDGTYMRLRHQYALNGAYTGAEIDFPDGSVHRFDSQGRLIEMRDSLAATSGVYPNRVWFTHTTDSNGDKTGLTAVDSLGRTHTFKFERMTSIPGQEAAYEGEFGDVGTTFEPDHYDVLTEAKLAAFDGTQATYTFLYVDGNTSTTGRDAAVISRKAGEAMMDCKVPPVTHVPLLQAVVLPDGLSYELTYDRGNMTEFSDSFVAEGTVAASGVHGIRVTNGGSGYTTAPTVTVTGGGGSGATAVAQVQNGAVTKILVQFGGSGYTSVPTVVITPNGGGSGATAVAAICSRYGSYSGNVVSVQLPTLGSVDWTYQNYLFPPGYIGRQCPTETGLMGPCGLQPSHSVGVATRLSRAENGTVLAKRTYESERRAVGGSGHDFHSQVTTVKDYEGFDAQGDGGTTASKTLHYHSNGTEEFVSTTLAHPGEYGLPFTRYPDDDADPAKRVDNPDSSTPGQPARYLSSKSFDKNGVLKRTTYVAYESNSAAENWNEFSNRRLRDESTVYHDDDTWVLTARTGFNGLGHYTTTTRSSNIPSTPTRVAFTNYTMSASGTYDPVTIPSPWITGAYNSTSVTEAGRILKTDYCFSGQFLTRKRHIRDTVNGTPNGTDVVVTYEYDSPRKNLIAENYHGGDTVTGDVAVGSGTLCSLSQLGTRDYRIEHKPVNPATNDWTETSKYFGASSFFTRDVTIDKNTGLTAESRDTAGVATVFKYDAMGRATSVRPTGRSWTAYWYPVPGFRKLSVEQNPVGVATTSTPLTRSTYDFDSLGRVVKETKLMPANATSVRTTTYDELGRKKTISEFVAEGTSSPPKTELAYDADGRISTSLAPDGSLTSYTYVGASSKTRVSGIWTGLDGNANVAGVQDTSVAVTEQYDAYGRLAAVEEKAGPTSAANPIAGTVRTEYTYDPADKLLTVTMKAPAAGSVAGPVQRRLFDYDGRGFLRWESQPEAGMTSYLYDARGHVLSKTQAGAQSQFDLEYTYDPAERVVTVKGRNPEPASGEPAFRVLKTFEYGTANISIWEGAGSDKIQGKLWKAARYNHIGDLGRNTPELYKIEDQYSYHDSAGRMTIRHTTISDEYDEVLKEIDFMTEYNALDLPELVWYPMCEGCGYSEDIDRSSESRTYDRGRLTAVTNFVNSITYWPNGMRNILPHANGIADTQTVGSMARPSSIKFATYDRCVKPVFSVQPGNKTSPSSGASVTLTASVTGTGTITYDWYDFDGNALGTNATITVNPTQTTDYYVIATNSCGYTTSQTATVKISPCQLPSTGEITPVTQPDRSWVLTPVPSATQNRQYQWRQLPSTTVIGTQETLAVASVSQTTTYKLTIIDDCGEASSTITLSAPLSLPSTGLLATATSNYTQISVTWPSVSGATSYELQRRSGVYWDDVATVSSTSYTDTNVVSGRTYAYRVKLGSSFTNVDVASTMAFAQAVAGQPVDTVGPNDMLLAVNKVREAAGWPAVTWPTILSPSDPVVSTGTSITARQILSCRARMNEARQALGAPAVGYTDPSIEYQQIKASYINDVQQGAQ